MHLYPITAPCECLLVDRQKPQLFLCRCAWYPVVDPSYSREYYESNLPRVWDFPSAFTELHEFLSGHFCNLSRTLWTVAPPSKHSVCFPVWCDVQSCCGYLFLKLGITFTSSQSPLTFAECQGLSRRIQSSPATSVPVLISLHGSCPIANY